MSRGLPEWQEKLHPRQPGGTARGGEFAARRRWADLVDLPPTHPRVYVPASTAPPGTEVRYGVPGAGMTVRGQRSITPAELPPVVYHVSADKPGIERDGMIRAGGVGGLGGDRDDRIVSMTIDRRIAAQLAKDMRFAGRLARDYGDTPHGSPARAGANERVLRAMAAQARAERWDFDQSADWLRSMPFVMSGHDVSDLVNQFYATRTTENRLSHEALRERHGEATARRVRPVLRNPIFTGGIEALRAINPDTVGIVPVYRDQLDTGALLVDLDVGKNSLEEVRLYGDVPLTRSRPDEHGWLPDPPWLTRFSQDVARDFPHMRLAVKLNADPANRRAHLLLQGIRSGSGDRGHGDGTEVMRRLLDLADQHRRTVRLYVVADTGGDEERLRAWYARLGFRPAPAYGANAMVRTPRPTAR